MNRCKQIRSSLRVQGIDPHERTYIRINNPNNSVTIELNPNCGRAFYQDLKTQQNKEKI